MTGGWVWKLPEGDHQTPKGLTPKSMSPFEVNDPLRGASEAVDDSLEGEL